MHNIWNNLEYLWEQEKHMPSELNSYFSEKSNAFWQVIIHIKPFFYVHNSLWFLEHIQAHSLDFLFNHLKMNCSADSINKAGRPNDKQDKPME